MSDLDRASVKSGSTHTSDTGGVGSDVTDSTQSQPLAIIHVTPASQSSHSHITSASELPSRKFQFSIWHELRSSEVYGPQLKAPRVRRGPAEKEKAFHLMVDEDNNKLHHDLSGRKRNRHRDTMEDWEESQLASFPCQDLQHRYQISNSDRILDRLRDVVFINLRDNALQDLSSYTFRNCEYLNLDCNFLCSFKGLPKLRVVRHLSMRDNDISSFNGLSVLSGLPLEELFLIGNPISFCIGYRQKVFTVLPRLKFLDGVVKQEEDMDTPPPDQQQSRCVIS